MRRRLVIVLLIAALLPLGSCSWLAQKRQARQEKKTAALERRGDEAKPERPHSWLAQKRQARQEKKTAALERKGDEPKPERPQRSWWSKRWHRSRNLEWIEVIFTDPALNQAVRKAIHRPKGKLYTIDVADLTFLKIPGWNVKDLSGIESCRGLTKLDLSWNPELHSLEPLKTLANLSELKLRNLYVKDIGPLKGLTRLTRLDLGNNEISDLRPLEGLTALTYLDLGYNRVTNLAPLANLSQLQHLILYRNQVRDLSPLAGLSHLSELDLASNQVADIGPLLENARQGGLGRGDLVNLFGNPLSSAAMSVEVPQLKSRKVNVRLDAAKYYEPL
jgi:hypothetical protein